MNRRWVQTAGFAVAALCALAVALRFPATAVARPWIDMGVKDDFAIDQPIVTFELIESGSGASLGPFGESFFGLTNQFYLDTGAGSIIAINDAEAELQDNDYVTEGTVLEQGVAGYSILDVSAEYTVKITDADGNTITLPSTTRIMSGQFEDLFSVNGIVGMPAMIGRVVTLDESVWSGGELTSLGVSISNALPSGSGHRYSVPIRARLFEVEGEDVLPTVAPITLLDMSIGLGNRSATGAFVLDTGASVSFISSKIAKSIGLDSNGDGELDSGDENFQDLVPISGIGGAIEAPQFLVDRFSVLTEQGVDLVWSLESSLSVIIVDIHEDIDGVLGSDLLTSGWLEALLGGGTDGPIQKAHFDFRQLFEDGDVGKIYFDLTRAVDALHAGAIAGDYNWDGIVNAADYTVWRNAYTGSYDAAADGNNNFIMDNGDYAIWKSNYGNTGPAGPGAGGISTAPEPNSLLLLLLVALASVLARPRRSLAG